MSIEELRAAYDAADAALQATLKETELAFEERDKAWDAFEAKRQEEIGLRARLLTARTNFSTPNRTQVIKDLEHQIHQLKGPLRELGIACEIAGQNALNVRNNESDFYKEARSAYNRYHNAINGEDNES